jgi:hypothetical protein
MQRGIEQRGLLPVTEVSCAVGMAKSARPSGPLESARSFGQPHPFQADMEIGPEPLS